ncbi:hypothetical protein G6F43_012125 [Rhizopus delemar]|nr:hypothetical protein G6F43_012125 [Rhizopus delemar]KAG1627769.1 hypothetical protein G6F44_012103 [Rhizopus delemar]
MNQLNKRTEQETVLPPTYAKLPTIKLEEEPNPFEESFEANIVGYSVMTEKYHYKDKERKKRTRKTKMREEEDVKRKNFLERNRIAALKCRQRKKQWLENLQIKLEYLTADNEQYHLQTNALREELIHLKTLLLAHKDCPVNQQEIHRALNQPIPFV